MQASKKVTIITPTYNRASFLPETIESVLDQTYPNIEYFLIDDGSTDNTADVVKRYKNRVRYLYHSNAGEASSVNRGWELATGDYVCVVGDDDPQLPNLVRRSVEVMEQNPDAIVTYPDWLMIDANSKPLQEIRTPEYDFRSMVTNLHCMPGPGSFIRRRAVQPHMKQLRDPAYQLFSDLVCWWWLGLIGPFKHIPELLGQWRQHATGQTALRTRSRVNADAHIRHVGQFFSYAGLPPHVRAWERTTKGRAYIVASGLTNEVAPWYSLRCIVAACWYTPRAAAPHIRGALAHFTLLRKAHRMAQSVLNR